MNYLQKKKLAFMSIVNGVKGFVRTVSGVPPISLEDCVDSDSLIDWKLYGNSVQDGTPTPENSIPVVSVGEYDSETGKYKVPVVARGKNLLPYPYYYNSRTLNGIAITVNDDGTIILNGTGEFDTVRVRDFYLLYKSDISAGTYTLSGCPTGGGTYSYRLFVTVDNYYSDGKPRYYNDIGSGTSIDVKENCTITITIRIGDEIGTVDNLVFKPQLELGSTATDYEPYHAPITTNLYLDEPLRSQYHARENQWYYDKVDYKTGTIIRNLAEKTFVGAADENWVRRVDESDTKICFFIRDISNNTSFAPDNVMCDKFIANYSHASNVNTDLEGVSLACTTNIFYISIFKSRFTDAGLTVDLDGFKTWLSQNPVTITYILKEPIEETISIPKLPTIKGTTIYEIGTSLNASNMEATYYSTSKGG